MTNAEALAFVQAHFEEGSEAQDRLCRRRYGWEVNTQSREFIDSQDPSLLSLGGGPILIDRHSGDYWFTSSCPADVFDDDGGLGWSQLTTRALFEEWCSGDDPSAGNIHTTQER